MRVVFALAALHALAAVGSAAERARIEPTRVAAPPVIDARLDDDDWKSPGLPLSDWKTYNPLNGDSMAQKTEVHAAYDDRNLYFAFRCIDPEPAKVRGSLSRRDDMWNDDWVGLSLDSLVNPCGID